MIKKRKESIYVDTTSLEKKIREFSKKVETVVVGDAMEQLGQIGSDEMRNVIQTSDAPFGDIRRTYGVGKQGRIRSGKMLASVRHRLERGPKQTRVRVGWFGDKVEDYFGYQDQGFWNVWEYVGYEPRLRGGIGKNAPQGFIFKKADKPKWTQGIFALREARQKMLDEIPNVFARAKRKL